MPIKCFYHVPISLRPPDTTLSDATAPRRLAHARWLLAKNLSCLTRRGPRSGALRLLGSVPDQSTWQSHRGGETKNNWVSGLRVVRHCYYPHRIVYPPSAQVKLTTLARHEAHYKNRKLYVTMSKKLAFSRLGAKGGRRGGPRFRGPVVLAPSSRIRIFLWRAGGRCQCPSLLPFGLLCCPSRLLRALSRAPSPICILYLHISTHTHTHTHTHNSATCLFNVIVMSVPTPESSRCQNH